MDDFFVNENSIIDPDAKIPKRKRAMMVQAAKAFISSRKKGNESSSSDGIDDFDENASDAAETSESDSETPAQKRLRLAKRYLAELEEEVGQNVEADAADLDKDLIASRIRNDAVCFNI
jgi:ribosomal RNA-processing protein 9